tara:strand:+ start:3545 stop:3646 length:102 start_codon:yes stop_codon:yes gene_type:complete
MENMKGEYMYEMKRPLEVIIPKETFTFEFDFVG